MTTNLPATVEPAIVDAEFRKIEHPLVRQADSDRQLVELWIARHNSRHTRRNYRRQADRFLGHIRKSLTEVRIGDVQDFITSLDGQASATRANAVSAVKSLLSFAQEIGYIRVNVGKAVKSPPVKNTLAERIMAEADTMRMIALEPASRNRALLTLLYGGGLRRSVGFAGAISRPATTRQGRGPSMARAASPAWCCCQPTPGERCNPSEPRPAAMIPCSGRGKEGTSTCRLSIAS